MNYTRSSVFCIQMHYQHTIMHIMAFKQLPIEGWPVANSVVCALINACFGILTPGMPLSDWVLLIRYNGLARIVPHAWHVCRMARSSCWLIRTTTACTAINEVQYPLQRFFIYHQAVHNRNAIAKILGARLQGLNVFNNISTT